MTGGRDDRPLKVPTGFEQPDDEEPTELVVDPLNRIDAPPTAADRPKAKARAAQLAAGFPPGAAVHPSDDEWLFDELESDTIERPRTTHSELTGVPASLAQRLGAFAVDVALIGLGAWALGSAVAAEYTADPLAVFLAALLAVGLPIELLGSYLWGRSIGRLLFGVQVVDPGGDPPSLLRSAARALLAPLSWSGGFVLGLFDRRGQMLHDKLTSTLVVRSGTSGLG